MHSSHTGCSQAALCEIHEGIANITLNRPDAGNAVNLEMAKDLMAISLECETARDLRVVTLTGAGSMFCVGGDLKAFAAQGEKLPAYIRETTSYLHLATSRLAQLDAPTIAVVRGAAAGAGFSLACSCDLVLAAESATFLLAYTKIGLVPDGSSTYFLPRLVGYRRALELALTNRKLSAQEARDWGLVTEVVADHDLLSRANAMAALLASGPTRSFGATKRLFQSSWGESLEKQLELESQEISAASGRVDGQEGIAAFLQKRAAKFQGR